MIIPIIRLRKDTHTNNVLIGYTNLIIACCDTEEEADAFINAYKTFATEIMS